MPWVVRVICIVSTLICRAEERVAAEGLAEELLEVHCLLLAPKVPDGRVSALQMVLKNPTPCHVAAAPCPVLNFCVIPCFSAPSSLPLPVPREARGISSSPLLPDHPTALAASWAAPRSAFSPRMAASSMPAMAIGRIDRDPRDCR